jgi:hypothetical protein
MPIIPPDPFTPRWHYQEFSSGPTPNPNIDAALTWLNNTIVPPDGEGTVFGNIDGKGDARLFWYGVQYWVVEKP